MNKNKLFGLAYILLGVLVAIGPKTLFPVCPVEEKVMKCHWTGQAMLVVGGLLVLLGIVALCIAKSKDANLITSLMAAGCGIAVLAFPMGIIGGCGKDTMLCRTTAFPMLYLLGGIVIVAALVHIWVSVKKASA